MNNIFYTKNKKGIFHILLAALGFAFMSFFARMSGDLPSIEKAFFRNLISFFFAGILLLKSSEGFKCKKESVYILILRSTFGLLGIVANYYAIDTLSLGDSNMLNKLSPFFAMIFSYLILKEKVSSLEWATVFFAFIGALFIIKPTFNISCIPAVIGALGGLFAGLAYTCVRILGKKNERKEIIVFFFSGFSTIVLLPFLIINFKPMSFYQLFCLLLCGLSAMFAQFNVTTAYSLAPAKQLSVFDYSQILFASLLGFIFLDQIPDKYSFVGYFIIISSATIKWFYSNKIKTT